MANQLVKTTFEAGPDDKLAAVDVYKQAGGSGSINRIQPLTIEVSQLLGGGFGSDLLGEAQKAINDAKNMAANAVSGFTDALSQAISDKTRNAAKAKDLLSGTIDDIKVNKEELTKRVLSASSEFSTSMRGMTAELQDGMVKNIPLRSDMICTVNDIKAKINSSELKNVESIGRLVNEISKTNIFKAKDNSALAGILGTVIGTASRIGIPDSYNSIASTITDTKLLLSVTKIALPQVIDSSNMATLKSISRSPIGKLIESLSPGTIKSISKSYKFPQKTDKKNREDFDLVNVLQTVYSLKNDWGKTARGRNETISSLMEIQDGSNDFKKLLLSQTRNLDDSNKHYGFAASVKRTSVRQAIKKDFPTVTTSSLDRMRKTYVEVTSPNML